MIVSLYVKTVGMLEMVDLSLIRFMTLGQSAMNFVQLCICMSVAQIKIVNNGLVTL